MLDYPWTDILIACTFVLGGLAGLLLITTKYPGSRFLGQLIFSYLLVIFFALGDDSSSWELLGLTILVVLFFLYCKAFFLQKNRIGLYHIVPPSLVALALFFADGAPWVQTGLSVVFTIGYLLLTMLFLKKEAASRGIYWFANPGSRLVWFRNFVALNVLSILCWLLIPNLSVQIQVSMVLGLLSIVYVQVFRESAFLSPIPLGNKYQKSTLSPEIKSMILGKLDAIFEQENFHLRDDASLTTLAQELGATTHHLSQVLNESKKISFQDLLAQHRIREACRLLKEDDQSNIKIENIASMVGYNSKSAFNTAFKKRTGRTPSQYRDAKDVSSYREERLPERKTPSDEDGTFSLIKNLSLKLKTDMIQHFLKIFGRNIGRNGLFSFLNVFGLTVGFTCSFLIYLYVQDELSYDKSLANSERTYRVSWMSDNPQTRTPHPMAQAMANDLPEVEQAVSFSPWYGPGLSKDFIRVKNIATNVIFEEPDFYFADSTFFDIFQLKLLEGDKDALKKPFSLVITEPMAKKYFGDSSAIGKELILNDMPIAVSAVVEPMPEHSHFHFNAIIPYVTLKQINPTDDWMTWADFGHFNYIRLAEGTDALQLEEKIQEWVINYLDWSESSKERLLSGEIGFELQPIASIHLNSHLRWELENNGNILYTYILTAILGFLLLIASINYINLTTAKSVERAKEIGVRKTLGAIPRSLLGQFYLESVLFSLIALILSLAIAMLLLDGFNMLSGKQFQVEDLLKSSFLLKALLLSLGVGLFAGFYPAIVLSSFKLTEVLKGKLTTSSRGVRLRSVLVVVQFAVSAILISGSFIIYNQVRFMKNKDLGFDQEAVISLNVPTSIEMGGVDVVLLRNTQAQLEAISGVTSTALTSSVPGGQFNQHGYFLRDVPENRVDASSMMVDYGIEKVLGIDVKAGRMFDQSFSNDSLLNVVINESFANQLNVEDPIGRTLVQNASGREFEFKIIGVFKDFHFQSLHQEIQPLILVVQPLGAGHILIKLQGQHFTETISKVEEIYHTNMESELPFEYHFLDKNLASLYAQEERTLSIFSVFSLIALILASLGLLGMAIAILNQRIKEVGMRKILGATSGQIMLMILGQFARLVVIAIIIGLPLSYILMQSWIAEFSYQAPLGIMPFIGAIVVLVFVATLSVFSAVMRITYSNPVDALRYE